MSLKLGSKTINAFYTNVSSTKTVPTGVFDIPSRSGTYDVKSYAFARASFTDDFEKRANGTLTEYSNSTITRIGQYAFAELKISSVNVPAVSVVEMKAFYKCSQLFSLNLPNCITVGTSAFAQCGISTISLPICTNLGGFAFSGCSNLISINLPQLTTMAGNGIFSACTALINFSFPKCTYISNACFDGCVNLSQAILPSTCLSIRDYAFRSTNISIANGPQVTQLGTGAFIDCYSLTTISFPNCSQMSQQVFQSCSALQNANLPICNSIGAYAFSGCSSLSTISLPACISLGAYAFSRCIHLQSITLPQCSILPNECF